MPLFPVDESTYDMELGGLPLEIKNLIKHSRRFLSMEVLRHSLGGAPEDGKTVYVLADVSVFDFEHCIGIDSSLIDNINPYQSVVCRLRDVKHLEETLIHIINAGQSLHNAEFTPFVVLENSVRIVCGASNWKDQSVYNPFLKRSCTFTVCVEEDAIGMKFGSLEDLDEIFPTW